MRPVRAEGVAVVYLVGSPFETRALEGVTLELVPGEIIGLIGTTGSGKSTMLQVLAGILEIAEGRVVYPESFEQKRLWQKVGLLFQMPEDQLFEATVLDDVAFGPRRLGWEVERVEQSSREALRRVGLPAGYEKRSPLELSGGEKRRVAVAGVLAMEPELLLLDEPTAGLDAAGRLLFAELLREVRGRGTTVALVSHDLDFLATVADRVAVFRDGALVAVGPMREILGSVELLTGAGLRAPFPVQLLAALRERGIAVEVGAVTAQEACAEIARVMGTRQGR